MKKKIISLCLAAALAAVGVTGATLAYFTDTDDAANVFTAGKVDIELHEANQAGAEDEAYQSWLAEQKLLPTAGKLAVDKIVTVENTGDTDAFVWTEVWIPKKLYIGNSETPSIDDYAIHLNLGFDKDAEYRSAAYDRTEKSEGMNYDVFILTNTSRKIAAGATSNAFVKSVYMDKDVIQNPDGAGFVLPDGTKLQNENKNFWNILVKAYAIQDDNFNNTAAAQDAYYGNDDVTEEVPA